MSRRWVRGIAAGIAGAVVLAGGALALPRPPSLAEPVDGSDAALVERLQQALAATSPGSLHHLAVAEIELTESGDAEVAFAGFGADRDTEFEIGSVTKTVTATLFAEAIERGEVTPDTRVGELLDLRGSLVADVTLEALASHRSGLPSVPGGPALLWGQLMWTLRGAEPYPTDPGAVLAAARSEGLSGRGEVSYSNLGMSLLGEALAAAAGTTYADLVKERFIRPLSLDGTSVPVTADALPADAPRGLSASGRPQDAWTLNAFAPAGGIRSTTADLTTWITAILRDDAPGLEALEPRFDAGDGLGQIGWGWFTTPFGDHEVTWHNGMTGGFASIVALDREAGRAVIVLSDTAVPIDGVGFELLVGAEALR